VIELGKTWNERAHQVAAGIKIFDVKRNDEFGAI